MKIQDLPVQIYTLPKLIFPNNALQSYLDSETIEINYNYHYREYLDNLNVIVQELGLENTSLEKMFENASSYPKELIQNAGGFYNYSLLWKIITPGCGGDLSPEFMSVIDRSFNSLEQFKREFEKAALGIFGSGWAWVVVDDENKIKITATSNEENPLMDISVVKGTPIIGINMWERMYYLKYQNNKSEYITNFWSILNWEAVDKMCQKVILSKYL